MNRPYGTELKRMALVAAVGLALGAGAGLLLQLPYVGAIMIVLAVLFVLGAWFELYFLSELVTALLGLLWRAIAALGRTITREGGTQPPPFPMRLAFGLGFAAGIAVVLWLLHATSGGAA